MISRHFSNLAHFGRILVACIGLSFFGEAAFANPTLSLRQVSGPGVNVALSVSDLGNAQMVGYQAFLGFDPTTLHLDSGEYITTRFSLPIILPIIDTGGRIDLAAGINPVNGTQGSSENQDLVLLHFSRIANGNTDIFFRPDANPPTRLSNNQGFAIEPLQLVNLHLTNCPADFNGSGTVTVQDIFDFLAAWFAGNPAADFDGSGTVTVQDIFSFLSAWFAGC